MIAPSSLRKHVAFALAASLALAACTGDAVHFPPEWRFAQEAPEATLGRSGMVVSEERLASEAGISIMNAGGNAVDAAVATGFALAVTYPEAGNIGGGGYMVIRMADGQTAAIDYREMAPQAATRDMYVDAEGNLTDRSVVGHLAAGVPGAVAGLVAAHERFGLMNLATVLAPAIQLAEEGFVVEEALHRSLTSGSELIKRFAGAEVFFPNGEAVAVGDTLRQPALARTLREIAERGADGFYSGWVADSVQAEMRRSGGIMTAADLGRYQPEWREPIESTFRGYTLLGMPPSSSGGVTVTETLNIMETYAATPSFGSAEYFHRLAGAYQRAFIDRNARLGDPAFVDVPIAQLTSKEYAQEQRTTMDDERAIPTTTLAPAPNESLREGNETTHYSVVDSHGNAVSTTTTINSLYGSGAFVPGAGFFLNNEMDDFAAQPGTANQFGLVQGEANAIAPGKRMLSAMSPTIVLAPDGSLLMIAGARGGPRIITTTSQVILNVIEHGMTLEQAMTAPRIHHQALPDRIAYEEHGFTPEVAAALEAMGHTLNARGAAGQATVILRGPHGGWLGMTEPRGRVVGGAVGYDAL